MTHLRLPSQPEGLCTRADTLHDSSGGADGVSDDSTTTTGETHLEDPAVDLPDVGTYLLADPASREEPLSACVELDPRLGASGYSCVPLAEPDAEPTSPVGGVAFLVVGPE